VSEAYYVDASACDTWAATLRATIALLVNLQELASCGFNVDVQLARKRPHDEAILRHEDALAEEALRLVCNLLSERCSSMMLHVDAYPLALAALLDDDAEVRSSAMAKFRTDWEAYAKARTMALPSLAKHVQRSPMATRPMEDFARLGRFYGWDAEAAGALSMRLRQVYKCWGQENIVESAMQKLRDHEARDSSSKSMGDWKIFEALLNSDLLSRFGADAIEPTTTIPQPAGARINKGDRFWSSAMVRLPRTIRSRA
jgi:hypothetical protein